jgi:predicted transcriptional regulator of viral defense system
MNLAIPRTEELYRCIVAQGDCALSTPDLHKLGAGLGFKPAYTSKLLTLLEQSDHLVRIQRGVYMTMATYRSQEQHR